MQTTVVRINDSSLPKLQGDHELTINEVTEDPSGTIRKVVEVGFSFRAITIQIPEMQTIPDPLLDHRDDVTPVDLPPGTKQRATILVAYDSLGIAGIVPVLPFREEL